MRAGSPWALSRSQGCYLSCNWTAWVSDGLGSHIHGGTNRPLQARERQSDRDEILEPMVRPYAGAVGPGFLLMHDNDVARVFLDIQLNGNHLTDRGTLWIRRRQVAPQTLQEMPLDTTSHKTPSVVSSGAATTLSTCIQARGGHTRYWEAFWVAEIWQNGLACHIIFSLDFRGVYTIKPS